MQGRSKPSVYAGNIKTRDLVLRISEIAHQVYIFSRVCLIYPVSILRKSISGRHWPVRVADGPMTARCRFT